MELKVEAGTASSRKSAERDLKILFPLDAWGIVPASSLRPIMHNRIKAQFQMVFNGLIWRIFCATDAF